MNPLAMFLSLRWSRIPRPLRLSAIGPNYCRNTSTRSPSPSLLYPLPRSDLVSIGSSATNRPRHRGDHFVDPHSSDRHPRRLDPAPPSLPSLLGSDANSVCDHG